MIPSLKIRQIIKNRIQRMNITTFTPVKLTALDKRELFNLFFKNEVDELELLLNKRMNWDK
jgi:hypothetical protein